MQDKKLGNELGSKLELEPLDKVRHECIACCMAGKIFVQFFAIFSLMDLHFGKKCRVLAYNCLVSERC